MGKLKIMAHQLNIIANKYETKISTSKAKSVVTLSNNTQRVELTLDNKIIE
jgi:hypothetical protein